MNDPVQEGTSQVHFTALIQLLGGYKPFKAYRHIYRVSQGKWTKLRESVPYVKIYRYNPEHLYPKLNGYGDNGQRILKV
jgi:hypothetical protein